MTTATEFSSDPATIDKWNKLRRRKLIETPEWDSFLKSKWKQLNWYKGVWMFGEPVQIEEYMKCGYYFWIAMPCWVVPVPVSVSVSVSVSVAAVALALAIDVGVPTTATAIATAITTAVVAVDDGMDVKNDYNDDDGELRDEWSEHNNDDVDVNADADDDVNVNVDAEDCIDNNDDADDKAGVVDDVADTNAVDDVHEEGMEIISFPFSFAINDENDCTTTPNDDVSFLSSLRIPMAMQSIYHNTLRDALI